MAAVASVKRGGAWRGAGAGARSEASARGDPSHSPYPLFFPSDERRPFHDK